MVPSEYWSTVGGSDSMAKSFSSAKCKCKLRPSVDGILDHDSLRHDLEENYRLRTKGSALTVAKTLWMRMGRSIEIDLDTATAEKAVEPINFKSPHWGSLLANWVRFHKTL